MKRIIYQTGRIFKSLKRKLHVCYKITNIVAIILAAILTVFIILPVMGISAVAIIYEHRALTKDSVFEN